MPKQVRLPDGQIGIFGDDESNEQIRAKIEKKYPNAYPQEGVLPAIGRFARGAGRAAAGGLADAYALSDVPGIGILGPGTVLRLSQKIPGGADVRHKIEEFANAPTPSASETAGWWTGEIGQALVSPGEGPLQLGARGVKAGTRWLGSKLSPKLAEVARQLETQTGKTAAKEATKETAKEAPGVGAKPRLRMKAGGEIKEITPEGDERTVTNWTRRQMEKRAAIAKGQPTSSTAFKPGEKLVGAKPPPTAADTHAEFQKIIDDMGHHTARRLGHHALGLMGIHPPLSHVVMSHLGRRLGDKAIYAGARVGGDELRGELQNERTGRTPQTNPPALSQISGSPL